MIPKNSFIGKLEPLERKFQDLWRPMILNGTVGGAATSALTILLAGISFPFKVDRIKIKRVNLTAYVYNSVLTWHISKDLFDCTMQFLPVGGAAFNGPNNATIGDDGLATNYKIFTIGFSESEQELLYNVFPGNDGIELRFAFALGVAFANHVVNANYSIELEYK